MSSYGAPQMQGNLELASMLVMQHQAQESAKDKKHKSVKPLNAFMAFRAYYQGLFPGVEQKERSGYLTFLWQQEKDQARWTILAKGFTVIRDIATVMNTDKPNLKEFLNLNAPFVGLHLPPKDSSPEEAKYYLNANRCTGTILVEDVVANSLAGGFLPGFAPVHGDNQFGVFMAALPSSLGLDQNNKVIGGPDTCTAVKTERQIKRECDENIYTGTESHVALDLAAFQANSILADNLGFELSAINDDASFNTWCEEYFKYIDSIHMAELAESLMYQGSAIDQIEFSEHSEVQTNFTPYSGDLWTTYNISAPADDLMASLMEC